MPVDLTLCFLASYPFFVRFFLREQWETKVEECIHLRQVGKSCNEYTLMFLKLSKYASSLVSTARVEMSRYVTGLSKELE